MERRDQQSGISATLSTDAAHSVAPGAAVQGAVPPRGRSPGSWDLNWERRSLCLSEEKIMKRLE